MSPKSSSPSRGATRKPRPAALSRSGRNRKPQKCFIEFLLVETLSTILNYVYLQSRGTDGPGDSLSEEGEDDDSEEHDGDSGDHPQQVFWSDDHIDCTRWFPQAHASVCKRWRDILANAPEYWTRVVVYVGPDPTPLDEVRAMLERSGKLPLDFYVTRREDTLPEEDPEERSRTRSVTVLLVPHVSRCRTISYRVIFRSSLPSIRWDLWSATSALTTLALQCDINDRENPQERSSDLERTTNFPPPCILKLILDGHNFVESWYFLRDWLDLPPRRGPQFDPGPDLSDVSITIKHCHPEPPIPICDLIEFLEDIPTSDLTLEDVHFSTTPEEYQYRHQLNTSHLTLKDLPDFLVSDIFEIASFVMPSYTCKHHVTAQKLTVINCDITLFWNKWTDSSFCNLTLRDIPDIKVSAFKEFLENWEGESLQVVNVPSFTDDVLEAFTTPYSGYHILLDTLYIEKCPGITVDAVKRLVASLTKAMESVIENEPEVNKEPRFRNLTVLGCWPEMTPADARWFEENVDNPAFQRRV